MTRFEVAVVAAPVASAIFATTLLIACHADIAGTPEAANDLVFRAAAAHGGAPGLVHRHDDPSSYAQFLPGDVFVHRSLRAGELPLWDPSQGGGSSPVRRFQSALFHPLRIASVVVPERQAQSAVLLCSLALAFAGAMLVGVRTCERTRGAAAIAAVIFSCSAFMFTSLQVDFPLVAMHLPWLVLAMDGVVAPARLRFPALVAGALVFALLAVSGHPGVAFGVAAFATMLVAARAVEQHHAQRLWRVGVVALLGLAFAAVAWVPFLYELTGGWSYKTETAFGHLYAPVSWRLWPSVIGLIVGVDDPGTYGELVNAYAWIGPLVAAGAVGGAVVAARTRGARSIAVFLVVTFLFCIPGPWMAWARHVPILWTIKPWYLYPSFTFACGLACAVLWDAGAARARILGRPALAVVVAVVLATSTAARMALWIVPYAGPWPPPSPLLDVLRAAAAPTNPVRVVAPAGQVHLQNLSSITEVDDVRTHGATLSRRYVEWFDLIDPQASTRLFPSTRVTPFVDAPLLRSFGVGFALEPHVDGTWKADPRAAADRARRIEPRGPLELVVDDGWVALWRVPDARPRVSGARAVVTAPDRAAARAALATLAARDGAAGVDGHDVVELDDDAAASLLARGVGGVDVTVRSFARPTKHSLAVDVGVAADGPALVVVQELYEEGWRASVDGVAAAVFPVNLVARGVLVPPGSHRLEMHYRPPGLVAGASISLVSFLIVAALAWRLRRRAVVTTLRP